MAKCNCNKTVLQANHKEWCDDYQEAMGVIENAEEAMTTLREQNKKLKASCTLLIRNCQDLTEECQRLNIEFEKFRVRYTDTLSETVEALTERDQLKSTLLKGLYDNEKGMGNEYVMVGVLKEQNTDLKIKLYAAQAEIKNLRAELEALRGGVK